MEHASVGTDNDHPWRPAISCLNRRMSGILEKPVGRCQESRSAKSPHRAGLLKVLQGSVGDGTIRRQLAGAFQQYRQRATEQGQGELITVVGHEQTVMDVHREDRH